MEERFILWIGQKTLLRHSPVPANIHIGKGIVKPSLDNLEEQTRFQKKS